MTRLELHKSAHPSDDAQQRFDSLIGLDEAKRLLCIHLGLLLDPDRLDTWLARHHSGGLPLIERLRLRAPLILLAGEVGCGKTALATTVASPVARDLDRRIHCFETPSNIRGSGLVGEISSRITEAFAQASRALPSNGSGILIIDEADDLTTSRDQMQAHHEDRAGLNVLIKEVDRLAREKVRLAVILISNRDSVMDPAVLRRVSLRLWFTRPNDGARREVFRAMLEGTRCRDAELNTLVEASARTPPYSYSDLIERVGQRAVLAALRTDKPLSAELIRDALAEIDPSPLVRQQGVST